jgi:hypothetical protein
LNPAQAGAQNLRISVFSAASILRGKGNTISDGTAGRLASGSM